MPRRFLRRYLPNHTSLQKYRFMARFSHWFSHPNLWHLNRHSVASGVAVGVIGGMIPGPFQIIIASLLSLAFRVNLPVAIMTTFYTNPFTIGPIYWLAFRLGNLMTGRSGSAHIGAMPAWSHDVHVWAIDMWHWLLSLGIPLLIGLPVLTAAFAVVGYVLVQLAWRLRILLQLRRRRRRAQRSSGHSGCA